MPSAFYLSGTLRKIFGLNDRYVEEVSNLPELLADEHEAMFADLIANAATPVVQLIPGLNRGAGPPPLDSARLRRLLCRRLRYPQSRLRGGGILAVEWRDLPVDPVPIDLAGELNQFVLQIDDQVDRARNRSPSPIALCGFGRIVPRCGQGILLRRPRESQKSNCKVKSQQPAKPCDSKSASKLKNDP